MLSAMSDITVCLSCSSSWFAASALHTWHTLSACQVQQRRRPQQYHLVNLQELASGRTSVFVAHRLSTVQRCDKIVVMSGGLVAEQGTHEELMAARRIYFDMWEVQKAADAEAEKV